MKISSSDFGKAVETWAEKELCSKGSLVQQGLTTFLVLQAKPKIQGMFDQFAFLADKDGLFELESLHDNLSAALQKMKGQYTIPVINYVFDSADLDKIFEFAKEFAK